jgi:plastocyanin
MKRLIASLALAGALSAFAAALPAGAAVAKLNGVVGPGATISLKQGGKIVSSVKAGKYSLVVSDRSTFHNFHLKGPGVNVATTVPATGTKTFPVTLRKGTYTIVCDPHKSTMKRTLTVR